MGHDLEAVLAELAADVAGRSVEERITRGEDDEIPPGMTLDPVHEIVEPGGHLESINDRRGEQRHARLRSEQPLGPFEETTRLGGHPIDAVVADADDVDLVLSIRHATSPWPPGAPSPTC